MVSRDERKLQENPDDHCTILIYNQEQHKFYYQFNTSTRKDGLYHLQCPAAYIGDVVYAYMSFQAAYAKDMYSPSIFLGQVVLI
jgi:hypothetical protein